MQIPETGSLRGDMTAFERGAVGGEAFGTGTAGVMDVTLAVVAEQGLDGPWGGSCDAGLLCNVIP